MEGAGDRNVFGDVSEWFSTHETLIIRAWYSYLNHSVPLEEPEYKPPPLGVPLHSLSFLRNEAAAYS